MSTKFRTGSIAFAVAAALSGVTTPVNAADAEEAAKDKGVEKIVVVGARSAPRSVADSPVPVDLIGGDELGKSASNDMLDQLVSSVPSFNVRAQPISDAATLIRPVNLRGLSSDSTLILLNGKRRHRASVIAFQGGGVNDGAQGPDISVIPSVALKQVEVLRDGAAAQYGSDAIAGVMNFVLKDAADGGSISVKQGEYYQGDGATTVIDGNIGLPLTSDGFANLSFQYKNADATSRSVQRGDAQALIDNGNTSVQNPAQIWGNPEINDDITIFGNFGLDLGHDREAYMFGNYSERDALGGFYYRNPENRGGVYTQDLHLVDTDGNGIINDDDDVSHYKWLVGDLTGDGSGGCPASGNSIGDPLVFEKGTFLTDLPAYQQVMNNANCWAFNKMFPGGYTPQFGGNITDTSLTMGTRGDVSGGIFGDYYYDISGSVGRSESSFTLANTINPSLGPDQPADHTFKTGKYIQLEKTFNFDFVKHIDVGLDDPMNFAAGLEWREESFEIVPGEKASWEPGFLKDQGFSIGSHGFAGFGPESAGVNTRRNIAAYIDTETYFTENFLVGAALRYEDFTSFGSTTNYKLTGQYRVNDAFAIRGATSTGFRAPTVGQANVVNTQTSLVNGQLVQSATFPPTHPLSSFYGGVELQPEESTSYSLGFVYENDGLFITVDYYNIEVTDRIAQTDKIDVEASDYAALRGLGVQNPELISTVTFFANDFDTTTKGVDLVANYGMELFGGDTKFSLAYNWNNTNVDKRKLNDKGEYNTSDFKVRRLEEGMPDHRATFTIDQSWDTFSTLVRVNYFGSYFATHADSEGPVDANDPSLGFFSETADSAFTVDLELSYYFNDSLTFSAGASNLFDQKAEKLKGIVPSILGAKYYESGPFDYNGGYYFVKAKYSF